MLQAAHERRMELLDGLPIGDVADKVCVDFGVGSWGFAEVYPRLQHCGLAIGLDISPTAVATSGGSRRPATVPTAPAPATWPPGATTSLTDASVDVFFTGECIEHVACTQIFLDEIHRVLRPRDCSC